MSGPKVVDIEAVRRQQKRDGLAALRRLERIVAECLRLQPQTDAEPLLKKFRALRGAEQWEQLYTEAPRHLAFYQGEVERLREQQAKAHAAKLHREHRLQQSVVQMTQALHALPDTPELNQVIIRLANADPQIQENALDEGMLLLSLDTKDTKDASSSRLREFSAAYIDEKTQQGAARLPAAATDPQAERIERCWQLLGELTFLEPSPQLNDLTEKTHRVCLIEEPLQQGLLLDSLVLELSTHLQDRRAQQAARGELEMLIAELDEVQSPEARVWLEKLTVALSLPVTAEALSTLHQEASCWMEEALAQESRLEQRMAVLKALASVGYEVREGMATAWVEHDRIVVRKPHDSTYGVELSVPAQGTAFQTRVVSLSNAPRDAQRDREIEETWCTDFQQAREVLRGAGFETKLKQGQPAGATPIKCVAPAEASAVARGKEVRGVEQRKLPN